MGGVRAVGSHGNTVHTFTDRNGAAQGSHVVVHARDTTVPLQVAMVGAK